MKLEGIIRLHTYEKIEDQGEYNIGRRNHDASGGQREAETEEAEEVVLDEPEQVEFEAALELPHGHSAAAHVLVAGIDVPLHF